MPCTCTVLTAPAPQLLVLLWHGRGPREGHVLRPLAEALVAVGATVVVPDWDSTAADRGRAALQHSLTCAPPRAGALPFVVAGWSLGGAAALSVALGTEGMSSTRSTDLPPTAVVGLAVNARSTSPLDGRPPLEAADTAHGLLPTVLVHGRADDVVPPAASLPFAALAQARGWPLRRHEVDTDHAGVIGTVYDPERQLCVPASTPRARTGLAAATAAVLEAVRLPGST